ncbi:MAG: cysteine peptidase family C39 domain-containing protein [candidate division KSB1 bacterium]|nr:cysteine peptidase family C39 domain-containing protein [candidate division KSB1 bacterium]MDZ7368806.1 cysteine peptidase family C39 domain-containing protein [candidate division KSB1 bacterium]MDZ7406650.1 cysteine peptidase family C39 domain-containing protein [candidate division KSB1 bacterium]
MPNVFISKPHHKQHLDASCLPACVKMLLSFLGSEIEESTLRNLLITDDYGTPALNILMHNPDKPEPNREKLVGIRISRIARIKKSNGLNPGDSANPDTTESLCFFCRDLTCNRLMSRFQIQKPNYTFGC